MGSPFPVYAKNGRDLVTNLIFKQIKRNLLAQTNLDILPTVAVLERDILGLKIPSFAAEPACH